MKTRAHFNDDRLRQRIAQEAARILADEGNRDFHAAKHKAAVRLGVDTKSHLPKNAEIEAALIEHQRLFRAEAHTNELRAIRQVALKLMDLLRNYSPHIVGSVLRGTADRHSTIEIHLFCDVAEEIAIFLLEHHIPYIQAERHWRSGNHHRAFPAFRFQCEGFNTELTVFPIDGQRQAPPCPVEGRPMMRASRQKMAELLAAE